jgi:hypothetical protein
VDIAEWHDYTVIAQGNHVVHKIDGQITIDLLDFGPKTQLLEGLLAFQLHRGPAMVVQIKDVMLKELPETTVPAFDKHVIAHAKPVEKAEAMSKGKGKAKAQSKAETAAAPITASSEWKWLWSDSPDSKSAARLKKEFDLGEAKVKEAMLRVSCDNGAEVFLNGEWAGRKIRPPCSRCSMRSTLRSSMPRSSLRSCVYIKLASLATACRKVIRSRRPSHDPMRCFPRRRTT